MERETRRCLRSRREALEWAEHHSINIYLILPEVWAVSKYTGHRRLGIEMGVVQQKPLGTMKTGVSGQLKTPFVATVVVLFVIWSLLSLDMPSLRPTLVSCHRDVFWTRG